MTFDKIAESNNCNCLNGCSEDYTNVFARKVGIAKTLKLRDFKTHHERNKVPSQLNNCKEVCGFRGISVDIWNDESKDIVLKKYFTTIAFSPKYKSNISIIKLKQDAGIVKHTPVNNPLNEFHYDFYKSDNFVIESIELVDLIPLKTNV
jgi:hypothetical protein